MTSPAIPRLPEQDDARQGTEDSSKDIQSTTDVKPIEKSAPGKKRRNHRAGKKTKNRRRSFAATEEDGEDGIAIHPSLDSRTLTETRPSFYRMGQSGRSESSFDSEALLDHRDHPPMRIRRDSRISHNPQGTRQAPLNSDTVTSYGYPQESQYSSKERHHQPLRQNHAHVSSGSDSEENGAQTSDRTPLLSNLHHDAAAHGPSSGYGMYTGQGRGGQFGSPIRRRSTNTSTSSKGRRRLPSYQPSTSSPYLSHNVNNPPSVPNSPKLGPRGAYDDVMVTGSYEPRLQEDRRTAVPPLRDQIVDIDSDGKLHILNSSPPTSRKDVSERRRITALPAEEDVCFPLDGLSQIAEDEYAPQGQDTGFHNTQRRRRCKQWPDLAVLEEWSREEKEVRSEGVRAKKISEPVLVGGRLRPQKHGWHRAEEDAPYRFTYFNEEIPSTIHSQTISELLQPDQSFRALFIPDPPELSDQSSGEEEMTSPGDNQPGRNALSPNNQSRTATRHSSILGEATTMSPKPQSTDTSGELTPSGVQPKEKLKKVGTRPTFWLDVLSPTDTEMRVISKTFGIHPLTAEDIMMQEAREKVELFRNYYLVNYRTFEQDMNSEDCLEPVNMYVVVFREGVISFHFSMIPHPANVRRRIRQLKDYLILSSDWISYAIIDDITDAFAPLIQSIEDEVDDIDDAILQLHSGNKEETAGEKSKSSKGSVKWSEAGEGNLNDSGSDMLRRVGEGRKKVMGLYRLLGNKADVIKGFAKRCNEKWEVAPRSEIGLYLGDIQDHVLTMTSNLGHYETLLSRAHSNYLAQINIRMNERQEQTADVLGKLTVLGTIVLPMNIITGMWGMNVLVPGQDVDNLYWFWSISAGLLLFGISCFFIAKRVYGIV